VKITHTAEFVAGDDTGGDVVEMTLVRDVLSQTGGMVFSQDLTISIGKEEVGFGGEMTVKTVKATISAQDVFDFLEGSGMT